MLPAILAWIAANWVTLVWQISAPIAISILRYFGVISWAKAQEYRLYAKLKTTKTYYAKEDFVIDKNGKSDVPAPDLEPGTTNTNMSVGNQPDNSEYPTT